MIGQTGIDGDVQDRMDAYRGNPQALMQRYSQTQELVDLLALQKLKSEKEAAARQMQMQLESAGLPTVAQQREQEVLDLTKKEVAQQAGVGAQQQLQRQQEAMKTLMQQAGAPQIQTPPATPQPNQPPMRPAGITNLPAPNMMPPKAMAGGGIVAFQAGGDPEEEQRRQAPTADELMRRRQQVQLPQGNRALAESGVRRLMAQDPDALFELRRRQAQEAYGLTPEERAAREERIRQMEQSDAQMYGPGRQRSEALARFLLGAGRSSTLGGALTAGGAAVTNYSSQMRELQRRRMLEQQARQQELEDIARGARGKGLEIGAEAEKTGIGSLQAGTKAAADLYGSEASLAAAGIRAAAAAGKSANITAAELDKQFIDNRAQQLKAQNPGMNDLDAVVNAQAELMQRKAQGQFDPGLANAMTTATKEDPIIKNLSLKLLQARNNPARQAEIQAEISARTREIEANLRSTAQRMPPTGTSTPNPGAIPPPPAAGAKPPPPPPGFVLE